MEVLSLVINKDTLDSDFGKISDISPDLLCVFFAPEFTKNKDLLNKISDKFKDCQVVGCSTSGEIINNSLETDSISVMAIKFKSSEIVAVSEVVASSDDSNRAACAAAEKLKRDDLVGVMVIAPGLNINGSKIAHGISNVVGDDVTVFGGLAGDGAEFSETHTLFNGVITNNALVLVGLYGGKLKIKASSRGGWNVFGPSRRVTKAVDNVLYELDGEPALDLYLSYLGDKAKDLPASGLLSLFRL